MYISIERGDEEKKKGAYIYLVIYQSIYDKVSIYNYIYTFMNKMITQYL